jgi:hypothetical protein
MNERFVENTLWFCTRKENNRAFYFLVVRCRSLDMEVVIYDFDREYPISSVFLNYKHVRDDLIIERVN